MKPEELPVARTACPACGSEKKVCELVMKGKLPDVRLPLAHVALATLMATPNGGVVVPIGFDVGSELIKRVAQPRFEICGECGSVYVKWWEVVEAKAVMGPESNGNSSEAIRKKLLG